jgi:hypothetical protein
MLSSIYPEVCRKCKNDLKCHLCGDLLCSECSVDVKSDICCRPCSVSIREDEGLVQYFDEWHKDNDLADIQFTKSPKMVRFENGSLFSIAEFETEKIIGSVSFRSDGQCDTEAIRMDNEQTIFNKYRILVSRLELNEFLNSIYQRVSKEST